MKVSTYKELSKAVGRDELVIVIEIDSAVGKIVSKIKATGAVAWGVCIAALAAGVTLIIAAVPATTVAPPAGPAMFFLAAPAVAPAIAILGLPAVIGAISIAVAAGSVGVLNKLRKYRMEEKDGMIILRKR